MKTLSVFVDLTKALDKVWKEGLLFKHLRKRVCGNVYSWIQSYLFQRSALVRLDGQTSSSVKIREGVPQGGVISPTLFIIFIDDICDQLSSHIPRALHADGLALWTKAEQVTTAAIRIQEAMNLISDWAKEWLVVINRTKTEATCFSLSPKRGVHPADQWTRNPPTRHPNVPRSEVRKLTWSPHISTMHSKGLRKMALMKKLAGTKWGANMKILNQVYTATVRPHMEYASSAWSSAARTSLGQLTKTQNARLRIITGGMKTAPISELERTAGLLSLGERRDEKLLRQSDKMKRLPSHPLHAKFEAPTNNRLKRQSPNHLVQALQQKHRTPSSARNQPLEMLQNYEDWQAETPTIILDIPDIQAKNHTQLKS